MKSRFQIAFTTGLVALLFFRLMIGFSKFSGVDEFQIYLIGLKFYTSGVFPYFGPDIVLTGSCIPGGMQGLLVGLPIFLLKIPEAPYLLLNALSFSALLLLAWYIGKRISGVPQWLLYSWLLTAPWTLHFSTHIENPSYVLPFAILFFVSLFELIQIYKTQLLNLKLCYFLLGFSVFAIMQLHMSWVLLLPYIVYAFLVQRNRETNLSGIAFFAVGAFTSISTLIPTLLYQYDCITGGIESNVGINLKNALNLFSVVTRFLSFSSYEVSRFIGNNTTERLHYLSTHYWVVPFVVVTLLVGLVQVGFQIWSFFRTSKIEEWIRVKLFTSVSIAIIFASFLFTKVNPSAHTFYLMLPVAMWYSFYCYNGLYHKKLFRLVAKTLIISGLIFQCSLFVNRYPTDSFFAHRNKISNAVNQKDYTLLGVRRESKFIKQQIENNWMLISHKTSSADSMVYYSGFEFSNKYMRPQNVVNNIYYNGMLCCKVDSIQPFSIDFKTKMDLIKIPQTAQVEFYYKSNLDDNFVLVVSINNQNKSKYWKSYSFMNNKTHSDQWKKSIINIDIPDKQTNQSQLTLYFWKPTAGEGVLYVDEVKIKLLTSDTTGFFKFTEQ